MYCRSCRAPVSPRDRTCPSCGRKIQESRDLGSASASDADSQTDYPLPPMMELDQEAPKEETPRASQTRERPARDSQPRRGASLEEDLEDAPLPLTELASGRSERRLMLRRKADRRAAALKDPRAGIGTEDVRSLVAERPEMIEAGLRVHSEADEEAGGVGFQTAVGDIDVLARDSAGGWVVITVWPPAEGHGNGKELVADLLQRMGWVRKHLGTKGQEVRGIVLLDSVPEDLGYAAAAVADTVEFKRYRFALTFESIDPM